MTRLRALATVLFLVGISAGTLADAPTRVSPVQVDGEWILEGDFHVHAFFGDGALEPWSLRTAAERAGLDVIAVTNHNQTFAGQLVEAVARRSDGPLVIGGEEITGRTFHLIAVGIERTVDWDQSASDAIDAVHAQSGVAIAAHPTRSFWRGWDDRAVMKLDGIEVAHPEVSDPMVREDLPAFYRRAQQLNPDVATIGSSDFHMAQPIGLCRTYLFVREVSEGGVIDAIRAGRTVARDFEGRLSGDPDLVKRVEAHRAARAVGAADVGPTFRWPDSSGAANRLSLAAAWLGLLGIIVFGRHQ